MSNNKDCLEKLILSLGAVKASLTVGGEDREIKVWFKPASQTETNRHTLGLLGQLATTSSLFEPFRHPVTREDICNCLLKLLELEDELQREAKRNQKQLAEDDLPKLWILTPTASDALLKEFGASLDEENWPQGIYFLPPFLRTAIVVIHQLPKTSETLWLRILGRGRVQQEAIDELEALPETHPLRAKCLKLLFNLVSNLAASEDIDEEDRELIMRLSPLSLTG